MERDASLSGRTSKALGWRVFSALSSSSLRLTVGVILARLLPVEAFGLLGLATIVIGFASVISQVGIAPALIQRKNLNVTHVRVGFTLSVIAGLVITAIVWFSAPLTATVFRNEEVIPILRLISLTFVFSSFGVTAGALLKKDLDFQKLFWVGIISYGLGYAAVGVTLSLLGYGVWSLAWASVSQAALGSGMLLIISTHSLLPSLRAIEAKQLLRFGVGMSLSRIMNYAARNGDYFVVGRWLGTEALGLYSRAYQLMIMPIGTLTSTLSSVLFPAYAEIQDEAGRLRKAYLGSISLVAFVVFPLLAGMAIVAPELICVLFGPKWLGSRMAFQLLCIGGCFRCIYTLGDTIARAKGAVYSKFLRHSIYAVTIIAACLVGKHWGIEGVASGMVIGIVVMYFLMAQLSLKLLGGGWKGFIGAQMPGFILAAIIVCTAFPVRLTLKTKGFPDIIVLSGTILVCAVAFIIVACIFPRRWLSEGPLWAVHKLENVWGENIRPFIVLALERVRLRFGLSYGKKRR